MSIEKEAEKLIAEGKTLVDSVEPGINAWPKWRKIAAAVMLGLFVVLALYACGTHR